MRLRSDRPREGEPHRPLQLALTGLAVLVALALTTWLLVRPQHIADAGADTAGASAGSSAGGASASATPTAATSASPTSSVGSSGSAGSSMASTSPTSATGPATTSPAATGPVPVAFIGDGLTATASVSGTPVATPTAPVAAGDQDWAARTAADLAASGTAITATTAAQDGAGYSAQVSGGFNLAELVPQAVTASTRAVVLLGSSNDAGRSSSAVHRGAQQALSIVHQLAPDAKVLLVAPIPVPGGSVPSALRAALSRAAAAGGATFVDPVAAGWPLGAGTSSSSGGAVRLTPAGQAAVATSVAASLRPLLAAAG